MNSETVINFCFIREKYGNYSKEIDQLLKAIFKGMDFTWDLNEKDVTDAELVIAELNGTSDWTLEDEVVRYISKHADESFWKYLQGLEITNYPLNKECSCCGPH